MPRPLHPPHDAAWTRRRLLRAGTAACLGGIGLSGCGGGGDDASSAAPAGADTGPRRRILGIDSGGTGAPAYFSATLDSAQPLTAAGVVFDTSAAVVTDADGEALALDALASGMGCRIEASSPRAVDGQATSVARTVRLGEQVLGPVDSVDVATRSLVVLGQRVSCTAGTRFGEGLATGLDGLRSGDLVQVWGEAGGVATPAVATRIDRRPQAASRIVRGVLRSVDPVLGTATVGQLNLRFTPGDPAVATSGLAVGRIARARWAAAADGGLGTLLSLREDGVPLPPGGEAELQGRVSRIDGPTRIAVDGVDIDFARAGSVQGLRWLALGARVEAHGRALGGVLVADELAVEAPEPLEFSGTITSVDAAARRFVVQGRTVSWSATTTFEGGGARLLAPRRRVEVKGRWNADRTVVEATQLHVEA